MLYFLLCKTSKADANSTKQKKLVVRVVVVVEANVVAEDAAVIPAKLNGSKLKYNTPVPTL
jgi:hypothetical protein